MLACTGAIGSAEWSGVKLRDVLRFAGFDEDNSEGVAHVQFEGLDSDTTGTCYGSSIPVDKAMGSHGDVLLAFSMNGRYICCTVMSARCLAKCCGVLYTLLCVCVCRIEAQHVVRTSVVILTFDIDTVVCACICCC